MSNLRANRALARCNVEASASLVLLTLNLRTESLGLLINSVLLMGELLNLTYEVLRSIHPIRTQWC